MKKLFYILPLLLHAVALTAQSAHFTYDKEKLYIHTDHVFFAPGETVFFKLYLVKGSNNSPSTISKAVYVEVYGPSGTVVEKQTYPVTSGSCEGSYTLADDAPGGQYRLKAYTSWMRNEKDSMFFTKQFTVQKVISPRILMKLEFPRKGYGPGDKVTAEFSMRTLKDQPIANHTATFTVSLGGETRQIDSFATDAEGKAKISFSLPAALQTTDGLLSITASNDAYTESIAKAIPIVLNKIDLQFLPEGGSFVAGIPTTLAFKAINEFGDPVDLQGVIKDNNGRPVARFESYKFGMGKIPFCPEPGKTYTATITSPATIKETYPLPVATREGVVLNIDADTIVLWTTSPRMVYLVGSCKDSTYSSLRIALSAGTNRFLLDTTAFPPGIARVTLYNEDKQPLAERLIFLHANKRMRITLSPDKTCYAPREKVTMLIRTTDEKGTPIPANLSLTVVDDKLWTLADDKQDNILSWLSLSSELRGKIEEPQFYFKNNEPLAAGALDLVMLTSGYRYFDFIDEVVEKKELKFTPDQSNMAGGLLTGKGEKPVPGTVYLIQNIPNGKVQRQTTTNGQFYFSDLQPGSPYVLLAQSQKKNPAPQIQLLQNGFGSVPWNRAPDRKLLINDPLAPMIKTPVQYKKTLFPNPGHQALNEVVVTGFGVSKKRDITGAVAIIDARTLQDTPADGLFGVLQGKVAGIQVTPNANAALPPRVAIRGMGILNNGNEPVIVINGIVREKYDLTGIDLNTIESVTVLKDAEAAALYGARAANGVISIRTRTFNFPAFHIPINKNSRYSIYPFVLHGPAYTVARRFYAPKYQRSFTGDRNDYRETIYWNPMIATDSSGEARLTFYNSDATTTFRAMAEGIGLDGQPNPGGQPGSAMGSPGIADTTYAVQAPWSVDAKIPPYLTTGDRALIPVVIKNNTGNQLAGNLKTAAPPHIIADTTSSSFTLEPGMAKQLLVPITAEAATKGDIRFIVNSDLGVQTISLPIEAAEKGFPVTQTFSGNTPQTHRFKIQNIIPGSLHARLTVYKNVESELLNGIESMLREPYGCFEQTSSTTYPNIFILKYLRRTGRSNPAIEKKALEYIQHGYQRLIGYETPEKGFEWFGHAPAHEALTAYGLLEFTDMQEFLAVDQKMLERTKEFLLSRRDGQGGFKLASGGYDRFASVPDKIANIYIVYAMTQAGYGAAIQKEYTAAVKKAEQSKDAYQLAMMALAADNMKAADDYNMLMQLLKTTFPDQKLYAETSVVNSRESSLRVESMSLYALALMRSKAPDAGAVASLISKILAEKCYYGYGSTQATVLALEAVSEYAVLLGSQVKDSEIRFTLNDHPITPTDSLASLPQDNEFTVEYPNNQPGIPYNLEVAYNTFTPPNSDKAEVHLSTKLSNTHPSIGETVRLTAQIQNLKSNPQPMVIAKLGIPAGLSIQPWQLKDLIKQNKIAYYELFDNYLVLYWLGMAATETRTIGLDLKADIPGTYRAKASTVYLYYTPEFKHWNEGLQIDISNSTSLH
jgi:TonB-dependent SusC/RagA subfamily outer membrane receptor